MDKDGNMPKRSRSQRLALYGVLIALAMILSYVETLIPVSLGVQGVKPGLANLVVFAALYLMKPAEAFAISMVRILLAGFTFGNMSAMLYSFAGGILSYAVMLALKKKEWFDRVGVSVAGGVFHNIGQLIVAAAVLENAAVFTYLPVLLLAGTAAGAFIGILGGLVLKRLPKTIW